MFLAAIGDDTAAVENANPSRVVWNWKLDRRGPEVQQRAAPVEHRFRHDDVRQDLPAIFADGLRGLGEPLV